MPDTRPRHQGGLGLLVMLLVATTTLAVIGVLTRPANLPVAVWWPAAGAAFAAAMVTPRARWPVIAVVVAAGTALGSTLGGRPLAVASLLGVINGLEMLLAGHLFLRASKGRRTITRVSDLARLGACCLVAAGCSGVLSAGVIDIAGLGDFLVAVPAFTFAHAGGVVLLAPVVLVVKTAIPRVRAGEVAVHTLILAASIAAIFSSLRDLPLGFVPMSLLTWSAVRFGPRVTAAQIVLASGSVSLLTLLGRGPFAAQDSSLGAAILAASETQVYLVALVAVMLTLALSVNDQHQSARRVAAREVLFRRSFEESRVPSLLLQNGVIMQANPAAIALLEHETDTLLNTRLRDHVRDESRRETTAALEAIYVGTLDDWRGDVWVEDAAGRDHRVTMTLSPMPNATGTADRVTVQLLDVTEQHDTQVRLEGLALRDPLTGVGNRAYLEDRLAHWVEHTKQGHTRLLLVYLDLDDFKAVNDSGGHAAGDALLIEVAQRLGRGLRPQDTVVRLGGDEFAIIAPQLAGNADLMAETIGARLLASVAAPVVIGSRSFAVGASVGMTLSRPDSTPDSLLREADAAMYRSKRSGKHRMATYDPLLDVIDEAGPAEATTCTGESQDGFDPEQFELVFAPIVTVAEGRVRAAEALAGWQHPDRGLLLPDDWPAEVPTSALGEAIGGWLLTAACQAAARWPHVQGRPPLVHVNVSARHLGSGELQRQLDAALESSGLPADRLVLEFSQAQLAHRDQLVQAEIAAVRASGVLIAADLGSAATALSHLGTRRVDVVRLPADLARRLDDDPQARAEVAAIIAMGRELTVDVVAVGVDNQAQAQQLFRLGCEQAQGRYVATPLPSLDFGELVHRGGLPLPTR